MSSFDPASVRQAVAEFVPRRPQKFQELAPAKEVIAELRRKGASYRAIAELLTQHCLPISKTAVALFCHEVLGELVRPRRRPGRNRREMDAIFTALEQANLVVVDCRAASTELFLDYFAEIDLPTVLDALGAALTLILPVNHELDSVDQVQRVADQLGQSAAYVIVRNAAHSDSFALFDSAEVRVRLKGDLGGKEITMTRLQDWLVEALNRENVTITAAVKHPAFRLLDRQRLQTWQRKLFAQIELATDLLLPTD